MELALMRAGEHKVARDYVLYREERARARDAERAGDADPERPDDPDIRSPSTTAARRRWTLARLRHRDRRGLPGPERRRSAERILEEALKNMFDGITLADVRHLAGDQRPYPGRGGARTTPMPPPACCWTSCAARR
ncbi:MAG: hypothetical protein U5R48_19855 [Gammaproteobacteria bacterium]|nr:hypothetical protein [Gammaproteobacteria bacterium]